MTTFTAFFRNDAAYAACAIEAETPEAALTIARELHSRGPSRLTFTPFPGLPVKEIAIGDDDSGEQLAVWFDPDQRLRLAAYDLFDAAETVVSSWERGDLAGAVRRLAFAIAKTKGEP